MLTSNNNHRSDSWHAPWPLEMFGLESLSNKICNLIITLNNENSQRTPLKDRGHQFQYARVSLEMK